MSSTTDKISGKTKQVVGRATGNKKLQVKGKAQETVGNVKSSVDKATDNLSRKF